MSPLKFKVYTRHQGARGAFWRLDVATRFAVDAASAVTRLTEFETIIKAKGKVVWASRKPALESHRDEIAEIITARSLKESAQFPPVEVPE